MQLSHNAYVITTVANQRRALLQSTQNAELLLATLFHDRDQSSYELHGSALIPKDIHVLLRHFPKRCRPERRRLS